MQFETQNQPPAYAGNADVAVAQNKVLRNTYLLLAVTLIPTIVGAAIGTSLFDFTILRSSPIIATIAIIAVFYGWIYMIERNKDSSLGLYLVNKILIGIFIIHLSKYSSYFLNILS